MGTSSNVGKVFMPPAFSAHLRRSCQSCREKKVKCSGSIRCSACQARQIDCVYGHEGIKGRPRAPTAANSISSSASTSTSSSRSRRPVKKAVVSPVESSRSSPASPTAVSFVEDNFGEFHSIPTRTWADVKSNAQEWEAIYSQKFLATDFEHFPSDLSTVETSQRMIEVPPFSMLGPQILEILLLRFGELPCPYQDEQYNIPASLETEQQSLLVEDSFFCVTKDPFEVIGHNHLVQLVDIWFNVHPFSPILSKTLLLRSIKDKDVDTALLAAIVADAICEVPLPCHIFPEIQPQMSNGEALYAWSAAQLGSRSFADCSVTTAQALLLHSWHSLMVKESRRSACFVALASKMVSILIERPRPSSQASSRINGIEILDVERELVSNMYWISTTLTLQECMQLKKPYVDDLPSSILSSLPPINELSSALINLDIASGNISTISTQARAVRHLWPLIQLTSTISHIYTLCDQQDSIDETSSFMPWQTRHLYQLQQLKNTNSNVAGIGKNIRRCLNSALACLNEDGEYAGLMQAMVKVAYQSIIIHMLVPTNLQDSFAMTASREVVTEFCLTATSLLDTLVSASEKYFPQYPAPSPACATASEVFVLGLAVSARVIKHFHTRLCVGSQDEISAVEVRSGDIITLTRDMLQIAQDMSLMPTKRMRSVKEELQQVSDAFQNQKISSRSSHKSSDSFNNTGYFSFDSMPLSFVDLYDASSFELQNASGMHEEPLGVLDLDGNLSGLSDIPSMP